MSNFVGDKTVYTMTLRQTIIVALLLFSRQGMAQNEGGKQKVDWVAGGLLMLMAPEIERYDKDLVCYDPPSPMAWFGASWLNGGMMGDHHVQFPLRNGVFQKIDCGFTFFQLSRNLYRGNVGVTAALQVVGNMYGVARNYSVEKDGRHVAFISEDEEHQRDLLSFTALRIPLQIGVQTSNHLFSLQTGISLLYTTRPGAQWLATAAVGPLTINYSQNITPLFKLADGTKAYPSSLSIGVDIYNLLSRRW